MNGRVAKACQAAAAKLIAAIEAGDTGDWEVPWRCPSGLVDPVNATTGASYRGGNWVLAILVAFDHGWTSGRWATYKQWQHLGRQVAKGSKGTTLIRWVTTNPTRAELTAPASTGGGKPRHQDGDDEVAGRGRLVPVTFTVFAAEQLAPDPDAEWHTPPDVEIVRLDPAARDEGLDRWIDATGADIDYDARSAFYDPAMDRIHLPPVDSFVDWGDVYATVTHELIHWTGHHTRCARPRVTGADTSNDALAFEELVAEFGAAMIGHRFGFTPSPRSDHVAYLASWARQLQADPAVLWRAASRAQAALDHLNGLADPPEAADTHPGQ